MKLELTKGQPDDYKPSLQEEKEQEEIERMQRECPYSHRMSDIDPEDGCVHCGFYAK